jgi:signal transduction histidine kinase
MDNDLERPLGEPARQVNGSSQMELLLQISMRLVQFETMAELLPLVLNLISESIPLRNAVIVADIGDGLMVRAWSPAAESEQKLADAEAHARATYHRYFAATTQTRRDHVTATHVVRRRSKRHRAFDAQAGGDGFIVLPLVVGRQAAFGVLQAEPSEAMDETHLVFLNTVVNQFSIALDRIARARRETIAREHAQSLERRARNLLRLERAARAEADAAIAVRDEFLAVVSHDLNNLASAASLASHNLLNVRTFGGSDWHRGLQNFNLSVTLMSGLLGDLVDTAAIELGELALVPSPNSPILLATQAADALQGMAELRSVTTEVSVPAELPAIAADSRRFQQILCNLIKNAITFSPVGGTVRIHAEREADQVRFSVADDGPGIEPEDQPFVFRRFWRDDTGKLRGTGLGLFIARSLVERHGGSLVLTSDMGKGSTFWFTIPIAHAADATASGHAGV